MEQDTSQNSAMFSFSNCIFIVIIIFSIKKDARSLRSHDSAAVLFLCLARRFPLEEVLECLYLARHVDFDCETISHRTSMDAHRPHSKR